MTPIAEPNLLGLAEFGSERLSRLGDGTALDSPEVEGGLGDSEASFCLKGFVGGGRSVFGWFGFFGGRWWRRGGRVRVVWGSFTAGEEPGGGAGARVKFRLL